MNIEIDYRSSDSRIVFIYSYNKLLHVKPNLEVKEAAVSIKPSKALHLLYCRIKSIDKQNQIFVAAERAYCLVNKNTELLIS